jgi:hypothetical protein
VRRAHGVLLLGVNAADTCCSSGRVRVVWQVPYLLPKFGFPLLRLPGWVELTDEELQMKAAPFKIAAKKHWAALKRSAALDEQQRLASEQKRSLQKLKWDDQFMFMAQDLCMRDVLRLNRAVTRLAVMAFVRITCRRSGAFAGVTAWPLK